MNMFLLLYSLDKGDYNYILVDNYLTVFCLNNTWLRGYSISIIDAILRGKTLGKK